MDQDTPNTGWNPTSPGTGSTGTTGTTGSSISSGGGSTGFNTGGGTGFDTGGSTGYNTSSATDTGVCPHCGQSTNRSAGLEQFLGRLGINEDMINNLKSQFQNVDIDEYLNTARDYLKDTSNKATAYTKENPGKVAAGVGALALGACLLYAAVNRDRS